MKTLTECTKKDKKFDAIVRDFEVSQLYVACATIYVDLSPLCGNHIIHVCIYVHNSMWLLYIDCS